MQTISNLLTHAPELNSFFPQNGYAGLTRSSFLGASSQKSTDISLVTAEGDKVTISARSSLQAELASYDYRGRLTGNTASLQGQALQISAENSFSIIVEGDLSNEELKDIQKLIKKIEKLGENFFSQPLENSLAKTLELGKLDSIAEFDANFSYSQQLTVAQVVKEEIATAPAPAPESAEQLVDGQGSLARISIDSVKNFVDQILETTKEAKINAEEAADKLPKFLEKLFKKWAKDFHFDGPRQKLADHIHERIVYGLKPTSELTPTDTAE